jgi:hypothetical protein
MGLSPWARSRLLSPADVGKVDLGIAGHDAIADAAWARQVLRRSKVSMEIAAPCALKPRRGNKPNEKELQCV